MGVLYPWGVLDTEGHRAYILPNTYTNVVSNNVPRDLNAVVFFKADTKKPTHFSDFAVVFQM